MIKIEPYILNWIFNNAKKGAKPPKLQEKSITITENGTTTVTADTGYDGLSDVDVTVEGVLDTSDATATAGNIEQGKTAYVNGKKITGNIQVQNDGNVGTLNNVSDDPFFSKISCSRFNMSSRFIIPGSTFIEGSVPYSNIVSAIKLTANKIKKGATVLGVTGTYEGTKAVLPDQTRFKGSGAIDFSWLNDVDLSNLTVMNYMFDQCSLTQTIPVLDTSNISYMTYTFRGCSALSNETLNNILAMCIGTTSAFQQIKTLESIGLTSAQAETCQTLSNWDAFVEAGWSSGY